MSSESPEQLLDSFKAAALSLTKLYKISLSTQAKARTDGYQDCLEDLLAFLEKESVGLGEGEGKKVRKWATERLAEGRDAASASPESEDETDKAEPASSPEIHRSSSIAQLSNPRNEASMRDSAPPQVVAVTPTPEAEVVVPTLDTFNFQSQHPYPPYLNLANLDLSDSHNANTTSSPVSRPSKTRHGNGARTNSRTVARVSGQKRKLNIAEIFDLGSLGSGKDPFGGGGKRNRHA